MIWETPVLLFGLWLVPLIALAYLYAHRKRRATARKFADEAMVARLMPGFDGTRIGIKAAILMLSVVCLIVSLALAGSWCRCEILVRPADRERQIAR